MGRLIYSSAATVFEVEDRALAHLRLVLMNKLRRNEPFMMHLPHGEGTRTLWVDALILDGKRSGLPDLLVLSDGPATSRRAWPRETDQGSPACKEPRPGIE